MSTSLRGLAKQLGVTHGAVQKAIARGRLSASVGLTPSGKPAIVDVDLALREWSANAARPPKTQNVASLAGAQERLAVERTRWLQLANDEKEGRLIRADKAERTSFECARTIREAVMNIPARLSAELAAETDIGRVFARLDSELRAALEAAATRLAAAG